MTTEPCRRIGSMSGDMIGSAFLSCPECGHTRGVHPGVMNKGLTACVICTLLTQTNGEKPMTGITWDDESPVEPQTLTDVEVLSVGIANVDGTPTASTRVRGRLADGRLVEVDIPGGPVTITPKENH